MRGVIVGGRAVAAFSGPHSRMVSGQRTSDGSCPAHVDHTGEKASMGVSFYPPVAGKGRSQEQQIVK